MAISIRCKKCWKDYKLGTTNCKTCGPITQEHRAYKVTLKLPNGKWKSKQVDRLDFAKRIEAKYKTQIIEQDVFQKQAAPSVESVWTQYLKWAKANKGTWKDDLQRWQKHLAPKFSKLEMDRITPIAIQGLRFADFEGPV